MVADILSTDPTSVLDGPTGDQPAPHRPPRPTLKEKDGIPVGFDFTRLRKPKKLTVDPAARGHRPEVEEPDRVAANYLGQVWGAKEPFEETFTKEPSSFSIGLGERDQGLGPGPWPA